MSIPQDLKYTQDHEWVQIEGNEATIGITIKNKLKLTSSFFISSYKY